MSKILVFEQNDFPGSNKERVALDAITTQEISSMKSFKGGVVTTHSAKKGNKGATVTTTRFFAGFGVEGTLPTKKCYIPI